MNLLLSLTSGGVVAAVLLFVQFLIGRKDQKAEKNDLIIQKLDKLESKVGKLENSIDERDAVDARRAILQFGDELYDGRHHSKERFDQILEDSDKYDHYCDTHPDFENSKSVETVKYIKGVYHQLFVEHKF